MSTTKTLLAPAKINTSLYVTGRREDGYHDLSMLMQPVSLFDKVILKVTAGEGVQVSCPGVDLPPASDNIARSAACYLMAEAGRQFAVEIEIDKQIPVAAGLGGGSSDAATVLTGLNDMCGFGFNRKELMRIGGRLGADVPFFVNGLTAWATGVGDRLEAVAEMPPVWYVLVNPGIAVSTAWVYGNLVLTSHGDLSKLRRFPRTTQELVRLLHNDLEQVTMGRYPVVGEIKQRLAESGAVGSLMSGSGPTVFGIFTSEETAGNAARQLAEVPQWRAYAVQPLD